MNVKREVIRLYEQFDRGDEIAGNEVFEILVSEANKFLETEHSPEENLFVKEKGFIKQIFDQNCALFERFYFAFGDVRDLNPPGQKRPFEDAGLFVKDVPSLPNVDILLEHYFQALSTNEEYILKNPNTKFLGDHETGRIWTRNYPNEGRKRAFWFNDPKAPACYYELMNNKDLMKMVEDYSNAPASCYFLLCEELSPTDIYFEKRDWHLDKLADQIKIFIPLTEVTENCGPMYYVKNTLPEYLYYNNLPHGHLHYAYIFSGFQTTNNCFLRNDDSLIKKEDIHQANFRPGQALFIDTRAIHTGSLCRPGHIRRTLTLLYLIKSRRNRLLSEIYSFY